MSKNKLPNGRNNLSGQNIKKARKNMPEKTSQRKLANLLKTSNLNIDKNAIQRIECGKRFITDIELKAFAKTLNVSYTDLLGDIDD